MILFEQFAQELTSKIQMGSPLVDCSRVDMALSSESGVVIVLVYTQPQLSEWMITIPPFQYPLPLLLNNQMLYQYVRSDIRSGVATLSLSELMRAATVGVAPGNLYGTMIESHTDNSGNMTFYVPLVEPGHQASPRSRLWSTILFDERYPVSVVDGPSEVIQLAVVHMPAFPLFELSNEQLLQITSLTLGWNYSRVLNDDKLQHIAGVFLSAAAHAQTIVEF